ncbi:MAG: glycosyltransferase family 4 protein [Bacteroidia bacterium]|nr:glycosyltransferase family 4 protein [Bacteroidia bacterium]
MRILLLNYEYPPLGAGAGVISQHIAEGLAGLGNNVTVVTTWFPGEKEEEALENLKIIRLKSKRKFIYKSNIFEMLSWARESKLFLGEYCKKESFDICFANFTLPGGDVALYLKRTFKLPFVIISHGHDVPWFFPEQMLFYHIPVYFRVKKICIESEANFVQTNPMKKNIDRFLGNKRKEKNIIIPNGGDYKKFKPDYSKKSSRFKIIFVGRLVKQKDPFTFLKAIKVFAKMNDDFLVHIIGDGPLKKKMQYYINRNNLHENVKFSGWLTKEKIIEEYQSANLKVAPSLEEGMSISIMESLACGQYVMTTPVSENPTLIREQINGELFNLRDYREIADKIQKFYYDKFIRGYHVPEEFLMQQKSEYDWDNIVKKYDETLSGIVNKINRTVS